MISLTGCALTAANAMAFTSGMTAMPLVLAGDSSGLRTRSSHPLSPHCPTTIGLRFITRYFSDSTSWEEAIQSRYVGAHTSKESLPPSDPMENTCTKEQSENQKDP